MPWYKSGTVSVVQNSNAVIGTGTSFIANSRVGDAFRGPDGGWYEVTNIASDSALSISPNYQGATASAGAYALAPMQGYVKQSADALRSLVNQFGSVLAVLGTDGTLEGVRSSLNLADTDGLPEGDNKYFTDARVRAAILTGMVTTDPSAVAATDSVVAAFGKLQAQATAAVNSISDANAAIGTKAAKGANNDITELNALAKAVTVAQGGTGVTTMAALLAALNAIGNYSRSNIVGTVSDSGGVPSGAILESGLINGCYYEKRADGSLLNRKQANFGGGTAANGNIFKSVNLDMGAFAYPFVGDYEMFGYGISQSAGGGWCGQQVFGSVSTWGQWAVYHPQLLGSGTNLTIGLVAIGRWK